MYMYLAFFIGMLLPLKWDYSTPVMYPFCQSVDASLHGLLVADTETYMYADIMFMLNAICRLSANVAIIAGSLLMFTRCSGHLLDVVIHSCNYIYVHLLHRLFMKNDWTTENSSLLCE